MTDQGTPAGASPSAVAPSAGASRLAAASPSAGVPPSGGVSSTSDVPSAARVPPLSGGSLTAPGPASVDVADVAGAPGVDPAIGHIVVSEADLQRRVRELGEQITADYAGRPPLLIGVLKGACFFLSDLARAIQLPVEIDFMAVSSYGSATRTSGVVRILKDLEMDLTGRHVLIVEDIVDSGLTLSYLRRNLAARHPASLEVVALLIKEGLQSVDLDLGYEGFRIPPEFVVGYGLDAAERYRNLPFVALYRTQSDQTGPGGTLGNS